MNTQVHLSQQNVAQTTGSGSPIGSLVPTYIGQLYRDTSMTPNDIWMSTGVANTDWNKLTGVSESLIHYSEATGTIYKKYTWKVKRTVITGMRASFEIEIYTDGQFNFTINDIIPLNFLGKTWFKINRFTSIINSLVKYNDFIQRQGTFSSTSGSTAIIGVGTEFLKDFKSGDKIGDGTTYVGQVFSVNSNTSITLANNAFAVVTNANAWCNPLVSFAGLSWCAFNNLINQSDSDPVTSIRIQGYRKGHMSQFEGTMAMAYELPSDDTDPVPDIEYQANFSPKDITVSALNMDYRANNLGAWAQGSSEASFKLILDGYLL